MDETRHIIVYGRTVILGTIEASLKRFPQLQVSVLCAPFPGIDELRAMAPDVILFDVEAPRPEAAFSLLETCPGLLMIGMDAACEDMLVLSSHPAQAFSADDLLNVICQRDSQREEAKGE